MSLFASTAQFYRQFRSGVPEDVARILDGAAPAGEPRRLLDVGTGPGFVIEALMPWFDEAIGVDTDPDLLAVATAESVRRGGASHISFVEAPAESFTLEPDWRAHLVTVCRAFHWFDRPAFLRRIPEMMTPDGVLAVFGDLSIWAGGDAWKDAARDVVQGILGEQRRAGRGIYERPTRDYAEDLSDAGFHDVSAQTLPIERSRTVDSVIGLLHSMSFASPAVLGERMGEFDDSIRAALAPLVNDDDLLVDHNEFYIYTARRP